MKPLTIATLLLGTVLFAVSLPATPAAADLSQLTAEAAKWESGQSRESLHQIEQLVCESADQRTLRAQLEAALVKLLDPASTFEARRFACQQLAVVGSDASVPAIAKLLGDNETIGIACLAFGNRLSAKADKALRDALAAARDAGRLQIISTLGNRRDAKAVKPLAKLARDTEVPVAEAAVRSLGMIASEPAAQVIAALRKDANPALQRPLADASLRCAAQLAESGKAKAARAIYEELIALSQPANVRRGAFNALTRLDKDGGEQRILQTLRSGDDLLKPVAITAVRSLRSETASKTFARELPRLTSGETVWMIESLAARGDAPAGVAIIGTLESPDAGVRRASAAALGRMGGIAAVGPLAKAIAAAKDGDEVRALVSALGGLPADRDTDNAIVAEIKGAKGETRARLISSLANRRSPQIITALFEEAENPDPVAATAAYRVLAKAAAGEHLPVLLMKFVAVPNTGRRGDVEGFVEQAVVATEDASFRSTAVRDALTLARGVESRCAMFSLLPAAGDAPALAALLAAVNGENIRERDCSVNALSQWPDMAAWDALYAIFRTPRNEADRSIALRSLVRLAGDANAQPDDQLIARYRELLDGARDVADLKQILGALGGAAHPDALKLATELLEKPGVQAEAEVAVKKITEALKAKPPEPAKKPRRAAEPKS